MTFEAVIADQRLVARIVNTAARCGCTFRTIDARPSVPSGIAVKVEFEGSSDALRRLDAQLSRLVAIDAHASEESVGTTG
jgi:hypothetical protein